ncbi:MAG: SDR family oxidoreductase [Deltaproteobacteria bacterium]|nr:MAG: SDR family oxidoreductase [Deltaproteobacteria bacterium]
MGVLEGKIVLITGASSGIGKACAEKFASEKVNLILTARRINRIEELSRELSGKFGIKTLPIQLDVRDREAVEEKLGNLPEEWKNVDILVNNAGLSRNLIPLHEGLYEDWEEMIDTNIKGLLYVTRVILPGMVARNSGHVINIGSIAGHEVYQGGNVYCATKWAVNALSKALRLDLFGKKVRVTSIDPGMVETEFSIVRFRGDTERAKKVYEKTTPLTAEDVAEAVIFAATRPEHVNISEIIIMPTYQPIASMVYREEEK